jgi:hypothetical protein
MLPAAASLGIVVVLQDYQLLSDEQIELIEKATLRTVVQALQEYSREAKQIFETTFAPSDNEIIVLAEDILRYALEVAECYPINRRFAGFIDYKRVRWLTTHFGLFPQTLLVDAKASIENNRDTLQQSQLPMDAEFMGAAGKVHRLEAGVPPHLRIACACGEELLALSTSVFVHFYYEKVPQGDSRFRNLRSIFVLGLPHARLKKKYNPSPEMTFFGQGKHSPSRGEVPRIRVYFSRLREMCPWRLQELRYSDGSQYADAVWRDVQGDGSESLVPFRFLGR